MSDAERLELLQGTLEMMILRTLLLGPTNGYQIAKAIERSSAEVFEVDHSSLYPALHRLEKKRYLRAEWRNSETNRRAKFYELTEEGRKRLAEEHRKWQRVSAAVSRVMGEA